MTDSADAGTAHGFAQSWNRIGFVYTRDQFLEFVAPLTADDFMGHAVLELGFGNGSLLFHVAHCLPSKLVAIDLGDTIERTRRNLADVPVQPELHRGDLTTADLGLFDVVYCVGVIHHLQKPEEGFAAVLRHTRSGGRFHCWVYGREGNALIRMVVDPVRRIASRLPWWITKYAIAVPLVTPYFLLAKLLRAFRLDGPGSPVRWLPLFEYTRWIAREPFAFFRHVAFDQLVARCTRYIDRNTIEEWLKDPRIAPASTYVICRNGNSWKFGGRKA
ncbi:MAG TPA: class I SAM-dependent methyltransferase [Thermoanaerobaculia bacterium]|nr:class I SAM-dependent methyltransferase [Thermoanaerobaculia bacterium]